MSGYLPPADIWVSCDWTCHRSRNPPSSEPGTDYATAYGTAIAAAGDGYIVDMKTSNGSATGRYLAIALDDGRTVRYLHLAEVWAGWGQRVHRGQHIAAAGASGYGSDWYYGAHVHVTLWPGPAWAAPTLDFEDYVGPISEPEPEPEPEPIPEEVDDMAKNSGFFYVNSAGTTVYGMCNLASGFFEEWSGVDAAYNNAMAIAFDTPTFAKITQSHRNNLARDCELVRGDISDTTRNLLIVLAVLGVAVLAVLLYMLVVLVA